MSVLSRIDFDLDKERCISNGLYNPSIFINFTYIKRK